MHSPSVASQPLPPGKGHPPPRALGQRIRVTNRSRLRIYYGSLDADTVILDEDGSGNGFATAGVDAEDAKEHHLQVVLSLQSLEASGAQSKGDGETQNDKTDSSKERERRAFIPVPDAAGVVADSDYEQLYASDSPWKDSTEYIRFSDTIDETITSGLKDGYTYDVDEEDDYWLDRHEQDPDGSDSQTPGARNSRARTKSKEVDFPAVGIQKTEFELSFGLMEMFCDGLRPTLHTDLTKIPALPDFEENFIHELEEEYFAIYEVPSTVPKPERLWSLVRTLYPFWKERKLARGGYRIMPQLNTDETMEDDHFVCFRRRDPKAIRRTRRSDTTHIEKLARLRMDFEELEDIARTTLLREQKKQQQIAGDYKVYEARKRFSHILHRPEVTGSSEDDKLLIPNYQEPKLVVQLPKKIHRLEESLVKELQKPKPIDLREVVAEETKQAYRKRKLEDEDHENRVDALAQPKIPRLGQFEFQWVSEQIQTDDLPPPPRTVAQQGTTIGFRIRRGRGGTVRCDRLIPRARRRLAQQGDLFTRKPLTHEEEGRSLTGLSDIDSVAEETPALSPDSGSTSTSTSLSSPSNDASPPSEIIRQHFVGKHVSADPDFEVQGVRIVDDYDVAFSRRRARLHDPGKSNPLHVNNSHLLAAQVFVRDARTKEVKVPLWPSPKAASAPVRISGLKVAIPQQQSGAPGLHTIRTSVTANSALLHQTPLPSDVRDTPGQPAFEAVAPAPSDRGTAIKRPLSTSHQPFLTPSGHDSAGDHPAHISAPHPPANRAGYAVVKGSDGKEVQLRHPSATQTQTPVPNGLGLQLGPMDLKLANNVQNPAGLLTQPQHYPYYPQSVNPTGRPDSSTLPASQRVPQPGMPAVPLSGGMPVHNYPLYAQNAAATAAYYAQTMNGLGLGPGQAPQGSSTYHGDYAQYCNQMWQAYHALNQNYPQAPAGSPHPLPQMSSEAAQHFLHGFRTNPLDPQSFGHFPPPNLNLRIPQVRQKTGSVPKTTIPIHAGTPERHSIPTNPPSQAPTYPTPLTRPPSEPRDLESSPTRRRPGTASSTEDGVSSPVLPSPMPTTPVSQLAVCQGKSPVDLAP